MRNTTSTKLVWFLAGAGLGTVIGLVTAPRSGAATRQLMRTRASSASGYISSSGHDYYDRGRELYDRGRHLAEEAAELFEEGRRLMESADARGMSA